MTLKALLLVAATAVATITPLLTAQAAPAQTSTEATTKGQTLVEWGSWSKCYRCH
jgi:hypothetical protein